MPDPTLNYGWNVPNVGGDSGAWGTIANAVFDEIDTDMFGLETNKMAKASPTGTGDLYMTGTVSALRVDDRAALGLANSFAWYATADKLRAFANGTSNDIFAVHENGRAELTTAVMVRQDKGTVTGAQTLDLAVANYFSLTTSGNITFTISNTPSGTFAVAFIVRATAGGSHTLTWPASVKWPGGTAPVQTASGTDLYSLITDDAGTTWRAARVGRALA